MKTIFALALTALLGVGIQAASAYQNCTTNCQSYGNQTSCTRSCF